MRIELEKLDEGKGSFAHTYQPDELNFLDDRVVINQPVSLDGRVEIKGTQLSVSGRVETAVTVECDRCLKALQLPVSARFSLQYMTGSEYETTHAAELTAEEMGLSVFDGEAIDLDEIVKEQILLAVPDRALCAVECKGMCSQCGADLNSGTCTCGSTDIDPRWAALKNFKSSE